MKESYSLWPILHFTNTDVSSSKIYLDISVFVKGNMDRRDYLGLTLRVLTLFSQFEKNVQGCSGLLSTAVTVNPDQLLDKFENQILNSNS
jgi:hypothetical protein